MTPARIDRQKLGLALSIAAAIAIAGLTLSPSSQRLVQHALCVFCGELGGEDFVLNVLLFVPLGLGLKLRGVSPWRAIPAMCTASLCIETIQYVAPLGRDASLGDVISNSCGGAAGYALGACFSSLLVPNVRLARILSISAMAKWLLLLLFTGYMFQPAPTERAYYGQLMRALGGRPAYPGKVLSATLASAKLPDWDLRNTRQMHDALSSDSGATLEVSIVSLDTPAEPSSVARIADADGLEVLHLGRWGESAIYSIRTHADDWRLRPLRFELARVFTRTASPLNPDSSAFAARYTTHQAVIRATTNGTVRSTRLRVSISQGWRLISPGNYFVNESFTGVLCDALWLALLPFFAGYWLFYSQPGATGIGYLATLAGMLIAGLAGVPFVMSLAHAAWWEVLAPLGGIAAGYAVARPLNRFLRP